MNRPPIRLGTRGSALALAQAEAVSKALEEAGLAEAPVVPIKTSGLHQTGGDKARFVREIERALLDREVDLAVHSAKDLPSELPEGLEIAGVPARETAGDAYVGEAASLEELREGARVGTSSLRRRAQLLALRPDLEVVELRGNVDTRLRRLEAGDFDGPRPGRSRAAPARPRGRDRLRIRSRPAHPRPRTGGAGARGPCRRLRGVHDRRDAHRPRRPCQAPGGASRGHRPGGELQHALGGLRHHRQRPDASSRLLRPPRRQRVAPRRGRGRRQRPRGLGRALAERMSAAGAGEILRRAEEVAA